MTTTCRGDEENFRWIYFWRTVINIVVTLRRKAHLFLQTKKSTHTQKSTLKLAYRKSHLQTHIDNFTYFVPFYMINTQKKLLVDEEKYISFLALKKW